jgi:drug/metabolite transporter (DMT)-like permease
VFGAIFAWAILREPTRRSTWAAIVVVLLGIGLAVFGGPEGKLTLDPWVALGALGGLTVGAALALTFVVLRMRGDLSILLCVGLGSLASGLLGLSVAGGGVMAGTIWPIAVSGLFLLPASFFALSYAARFTQASNVSLMLLLETVLGPMIVWAGVGEAPTTAMLIGGAIVVGSIAAYLLYNGRRQAV